MKRLLKHIRATFAPKKTVSPKTQDTICHPTISHTEKLITKYFDTYFNSRDGAASFIDMDWEQYEKDADILKQNFDDQDLKKLEVILKRMENVALCNGFYKYADIYSRDEMIRHKKMNSVKFKTAQVDDYWQYENFKLPENNFEPSIFYDKYELDKFDARTRISNNPDLAIFDIGAYIGDSALILREFFPKNKIYAFEAIKSLCDKIGKTIQLNNANNIIPVNLALGAGEGTLSLKYCGKSDIAQVVTFDEYVQENNIKVGLIKTDIEGDEWAFLQGAINTIKAQRPAMIISIYHNYNDFFKIKPFIESLKLGYKFSLTESNYGRYPTHEITLNCWVD